VIEAATTLGRKAAERFNETRSTAPEREMEAPPAPPSDRSVWAAP
jgi:hypothetical protein